MPFCDRRSYPDVNVEVVTEPGLTDIVAECFDAGVRLGESIAKDIVAVRLGPDCAWLAHFATKPCPPKSSSS